MSTDQLTGFERQQLLALARQSIELATRQQPMPELQLSEYSPALQENGASFVTLTKKDGSLRGCIGTLTAYQPLVQDVCEHAVVAALEDFRFQPVQQVEVAHLQIEISRLTPSQSLDYANCQDLPGLLRPGVDGVVLRDGVRRATFLPQVWEKLPEPEDFLTNLCWKMGAAGDLWRSKKLDVEIYQVEEFHE
jgi:AmmeMemoRadiSam system protein A